MTRTPDFDELIGADLDRRSASASQRVHELLVAAGPPPELLAGPRAGPTLGDDARRRRPTRRRVALLAAAFVVPRLAFLGGYVAGNGGSRLASGHALKLAGTAGAARNRVAPGRDRGRGR